MNTHARLRLWNAGFFLFVGCIVAAVYLTHGCVGAPQSVDDFVTMPEAQFTSWSDRVGAVAEEASKAMILDNSKRAIELQGLADGIALYAQGPMAAGGLAKLVPENSWSGLLRITVLEIGAALDQHVEDLKALPRAKQLCMSVAAGIQRGIIAAGAAQQGK